MHPDHGFRQQHIKHELGDRIELDRLITTISTQFINLTLDDIDREINQALQDIGEFIQVDRSYIFLFSNDGKKMNNTYEWSAQGIEPQIQHLQGIMVDEELPWFAKKIKKYEIVHIPSVADLPLEANREKYHFEVQNIQSLLGVPMILSGQLLGYVGFDSVRCKRNWSETSIVLLKLVGDILANALGRQRAEKQIQHRLLLEKTLAQISRLLISATDIDIERQILKPLGEAVKANRVYIFQLRDNNHKMDNTHEWCDCDTSPQIRACFKTFRNR